MKRRPSVFKVFLLLFLCWLIVPQHVYADIEWKTLKDIDLKAEPLDISISPDEQMMFILTPGEILVYSVPQDKVIKSIPIEKAFNRLKLSPRKNTLIVTSSEKKALKMIQLEFIQKIDISGLPFKGPEDAPVVIAAFSDYQCPYCAKIKPVLMQVQEKNPQDVKLVIKQFPLAMHKYSRQASTAALAADKQGKFWEFHKKLFENMRSLNDAKIQEIAQELGLNMEQFNKDLKDPKIKELIDRDIKNGQQAGVRGTPTIFVNGKLVKNRSLQGLQHMIDGELKK